MEHSCDSWGAGHNDSISRFQRPRINLSSPTPNKQLPSSTQCTHQMVLADPSLLPFLYLQLSFLSPEALQLQLDLLLEAETPFRSSPSPTRMLRAHEIVYSCVGHKQPLALSRFLGPRVQDIHRVMREHTGKEIGEELRRNKQNEVKKGLVMGKTGWSVRSSAPALHLITAVCPNVSLNPF